MWELVQKGGPMMYPIIIASILAFGVVLERVYHLNKARIDAGKFMDGIINVLKRNKIIEAIEICNSTPGPIAHIVKAGILKHDRSKPEIREAVEEAARLEIPRMEKHLPVLATIAHVAPLLGLVGTVTGMIKSFQVIQQKAAAMVPVNPGDLAGGIWEALLATLAGLAVAIPTYVAYNYLVSQVDNLVYDMETSATDLVNLLSSKRDTYEV
ncbi:MAG: MotA/TolQ/ExbB proton channel family protein [Candidatus Omnitrophica bacterium]|nr:MotA/TolQ/ExbB proton channel family protein [Candidatus Omnitrophota bacterium]MBU0881134.1 MotA/TolQ/ExbB proton channel family protein [Candidatus Omnitrophota bacterium]MBU0895794.1 MotA/TolQ/ExbB proton channel family protein [Candidatus Omnitrophota bacterium]MBU1808616.1 MotA/TolQ/ExbB proton channel family protein [Candidatus Omnitrophota bacterium]